MTALHELYETCQQSPWIDNLKRSYLSDGELERLVEKGIRGVTSNPSIFAKAIEAGSEYDEQFSALIKAGSSVEDAYWDLVVADIVGALRVLRPLYDSSERGDGFVSLEVAPGLAHDTEATIEMARRLHERVAEPNLLVKIPATAEGIPAIKQMIAEGRSINVTLIFSLERYSAVIDAYLSGLEALDAAGGDLSTVASVASFFVSRLDTEVDRRLEALADAAASAGNHARSAELLALRGRAAVAQARLAYRQFVERFGDERYSRLAAKGAVVQRPLFASTSTKNPAYPDLLYVDSLIGPNTVNTMPDETVAAFLDHGVVARTVDSDDAGAAATLDALSTAGVDLEDVTRVLEDEGVASFSKAFDELLVLLGDKAAGRGSGATL